jgi:hypothetical protein
LPGGAYFVFLSVLVKVVKQANPEDFNFLDSGGNLFAAVHIGSIGENDDSLWVGSSNGTPPFPSPAPSFFSAVASWAWPSTESGA